MPLTLYNYYHFAYIPSTRSSDRLLGQSILLKSYTPGVVTGIIVLLPYTVYLFYRLIAEQVVTWEEVLLYAPSGLLLIPLVLLGHKLGKILIKN